VAKSRNDLVEENARLVAENDMLKREKERDHRIDVADSITSVLKTLLRWGFSFGIAFYIYRMIDTLAGRTTFAEIGISFLGSVTVTHSIAAVTTISALAYGINQNRLRRQSIASFSERIRGLEERLDPNRTSSELTKEGLTNPMDLER
jgi:hypothetical protein